VYFLFQDKTGENMEPFNKRLKRIRGERGLSVKQVAQQIAVPESTYREWEYGRPLVGPPYVKLAEVLSVPLTVLMTGQSAQAEWIADELNHIEITLSELRTKVLSRI
jgi:transcriptional regulator with XRE-family HTH domain